MRSISLLILIAIGVSGCAIASGPKFNDVQATMPAPISGKSRLIIYRESESVGVGIFAELQINDHLRINMPMRGATVIDVEPGKNQLSIDARSLTFPPKGRFAIEVTLEQDREYYFAINSQSPHLATVLLGGVPTVRTPLKINSPIRAFTSIKTKIIDKSFEFPILPVAKEVALKQLQNMHFLHPIPQKTAKK